MENNSNSYPANVLPEPKGNYAGNKASGEMSTVKKVADSKSTTPSAESARKVGSDWNKPQFYPGQATNQCGPNRGKK